MTNIAICFGNLLLGMVIGVVITTIVTIAIDGGNDNG